jgi:hypothetical protein
MTARHEPALLLRLHGGLGNQLFEYAAGRALALRNHVPLWLDTTSGFLGDPYSRSYALGIFRIVGEDSKHRSSTSFGLKVDLFRRLVRRRELLRIRFLGRTFDPAIYNMRIKGPTVLDAYCQSPLYFDQIEELLRKELEFKVPPSGISDEIAEDLRQANSVCLHVRRLFAKEADGSIRQSVADFHGTCDVAYYRRAIRELTVAHGSLRIFIFSDDIDWAQQHTKAFAAEGCSVKIIDDGDPLRSFYLMKLCRHFIIANSSFSWWAAWLGSFPAKTVCVPPVWNRSERRFPRDLFPPAWRVVLTAAVSTGT